MKENEKRALSVPMLGAAYYPEAWDEAEQEHDIAMMVKAGCNVMRMTEFAWHKMEPRDGEIDFSWLHRVMDKLWTAGISVILGTPSATPPRWLQKVDPTIYAVSEEGVRRTHGARRNCCSNNPTFRRYSARIAEAMAKEFADDPRVVGWQIDNEINIMGRGCYCEHCRRGFTEYLRARYGTIENLNDRWALETWSQYYDSFEDIPAPTDREAWHNSHLNLEWKRFQGQSHVDFIKMQADILHKYVKVPVGTDMMPIHNIDYEKIAQFADVIQFNHYREESNLWEVLVWYDYIRTLKDRPFWNTETSTCWNGAHFIPNLIRREGFCRALSWLPIAMGGEANLYWLWRQHRASHELMHGSVLYANGRPMHTFGEVQQLSAEYARCADFMNGTKVTADLAMMIDADSYMMQDVQPIYPDDGWHYYTRTRNLHTHLRAYGVRPDLIAPSHSFDGYKVLMTPFMPSLEREGLYDRIEEWVEAGGTWVVGPVTDIRTVDGAHYTKAATGRLEQWTGAIMTDTIPDKGDRVVCSWKDGAPFSAYGLLQLFDDLPADCEVLASVTDGIYPSLKGKVLAFRKPFGKGQILVLGTTPNADGVARLLDVACEYTPVRRFAFEGNVMVAPRKGAAGEGLAVVEHRGEPASVTLDEPMTDLITGERFEGKVELKPFDVLILKK